MTFRYSELKSALSYIIVQHMSVLTSIKRPSFGLKENGLNTEGRVKLHIRSVICVLNNEMVLTSERT